MSLPPLRLAAIFFGLALLCAVWLMVRPAKGDEPSRIQVEFSVPCIDVGTFMKTADADKFKPFALEIGGNEAFQRITMINPRGSILVADFFKDKKMVCVPVLIQDTEIDKEFNLKSFFQESN